VFGSGKDLDSRTDGGSRGGSLSARSFVFASRRRSFASVLRYDYVVAILLGATLSRVIVGASPAVPTVVRLVGIVVLHRVLVWGCLHSQHWSGW